MIKDVELVEVRACDGVEVFTSVKKSAGEEIKNTKTRFEYILLAPSLFVLLVAVCHISVFASSTAVECTRGTSPRDVPLYYPRILAFMICCATFTLIISTAAYRNRIEGRWKAQVWICGIILLLILLTASTATRDLPACDADARPCDSLFPPNKPTKPDAKVCSLAPIIKECPTRDALFAYPSLQKKYNVEEDVAIHFGRFGLTVMNHEYFDDANKLACLDKYWFPILCAGIRQPCTPSCMPIPMCYSVCTDVHAECKALVEWFSEQHMAVDTFSAIVGDDDVAQYMREFVVGFGDCKIPGVAEKGVFPCISLNGEIVNSTESLSAGNCSRKSLKSYNESILNYKNATDEWHICIQTVNERARKKEKSVVLSIMIFLYLCLAGAAALPLRNHAASKEHDKAPHRLSFILMRHQSNRLSVHSLRTLFVTFLQFSTCGGKSCL